MSDPALSFDSTAAQYEASRPDYPDALLDALPVPPSATVLDLAAGTGKLTRVLARRYARVVAVEPLDGMRAILESVVPEADSRAGRAEAIPLEDASVDAVFVAQAFQWFAHDAAVAEIARVLRPGGVVAIVWNRADEPTPLPAAYSARLDALLAELPRRIDDDSSFDVLARGPFGDFHTDFALHEMVQTRRATLDFAASLSVLARLPEEERAALLGELGALLAADEYRFTMRAHVRWARHL